MTHTPGPWHVGVTPSGKKAARVHAPDGSVVADVGGLMYDNPDASLIAAAPAMLAALQAIVARGDGEFDNPALMAHGPLSTSTTADMYDIARAAIAEAGGE